MKELENSHRKYLGLKEIDPRWIRIEICNEVIYHNGTSVLKEIRSEKGGYFEEWFRLFLILQPPYNDR